MGTMAIIIGAVGVVLGVLPGLYKLGIALGVAAMLTGCVGFVMSRKDGLGKWPSTAGMVTGVVAIVASIMVGVVLNAAFDWAETVTTSSSTSDNGAVETARVESGSDAAYEYDGEDGLAFGLYGADAVSSSTASISLPEASADTIDAGGSSYQVTVTPEVVG